MIPLVAYSTHPRRVAILLDSMADGSSPGSPLSSVGSDEDIEEETITPNRSARPSTDRHASNDGDSTLHPNKRRRTGLSTSVNPLDDGATPSQTADDDDALSDISEDTFGSAPGSPTHDEYALRADQVTSCQWDGCPIGELGDADSLILHVQTEHISPKRAKYTCEWGDCARKGINHPSGYALKAHMRSHTKEKPFFCALPGWSSQTEKGTMSYTDDYRMRPVVHSQRCASQAHEDSPRTRITKSFRDKRKPYRSGDWSAEERTEAQTQCQWRQGLAERSCSDSNTAGEESSQRGTSTR